MEKYDFKRLFESLKKPEPYAKGELQFWDDEHISKCMLEAHLDQSHDAASRRYSFIDESIQFLLNKKIIKPNDTLLDLGCGPGLYASRFAQQGVNVTGIDLSKRSIDYAKEYAKNNQLNINYHCQNFFDIDFHNEYDGVMQIYGEINTFNDQDRDTLLHKIYQALKPNGYFVFDSSTRNLRKKHQSQNNWYESNNGFWKPHQHIVFEQGFDYEELNLYLDQYVIIDELNQFSIYRNWFHDYTLQEITTIVEKIGFKVISYYSDLTGKPYQEDSDWIALIVQKRSELNE